MIAERFNLQDEECLAKLKQRIKSSFVYITKRSEGAEDCAQEVITRMLELKHQHATIDQAVIDYLRSHTNLKGFRRRVEGQVEPRAHSYEQGEYDRVIRSNSGRDMVDRINDNRNREQLSGIIDTMPDRTKTIMKMHLEDKTMSEIATELQVTESRISQIQKRVSEKLEVLGLIGNPEIIARVVKW